MAVAFDAVGPSSTGANTTTSPLTWTHVCGASATHLLVGATYDVGADGGKTMSATYNSVAMTSLGVWHTGGGTAGFLQVWALAAPSTGSNTVSVTFTSGASGVQGGSLSFTGSAGVSAVQATVSAGASANPSGAFTGAISGNIVAGFLGCGTAATQTGSFTNRYNCVPSSGNAGAGFSEAATIASSGTVTDSYTMGADFWAIALVEVQAGVGVTGRVPATAQTSRTWQRHWTKFVRPTIQPPVQQLAPRAGVAAVSASAGQPIFSRYITGLGGTGAGWFVDQTGTPRMVIGDAAWAWPGNAGRWNSGNWQADFDTFIANRSGQGYTVIYCKPMGTTQSGNINDNGGTFDGLYPFQGGAPSTGTAGAAPSSGLTNAYWSRIDYMLSSALLKGITIFLNAIGYDSDFSAGPGPLFGKSTTEFQAYGAAVGARYASQPNLVWHLADDYFGENDALISAFLTGVRGAGDSHLVSIENMPESTSRNTLDSSPSVCSWGTSNAQYNFVYTYDITYRGIEQAYLETSPVPVILGDGYFYQGSSTYFATDDRAVRQDFWHAISSGARGAIQGSEGIWQYTSTALAFSSTAWWPVNNVPHLRPFIESLTDWHKLVPDTSSALVTAGRGTHGSAFASGGGGGQYEPAFTDSYVTASRTPDPGSGSDLAIIYLSHGTTITIDQTKMASGYTATWVDPVTCATSSATTGSTYNSTAKGNNSQGDPDWVLVLQAPTVATPAAGVAAATVVAAAPSTAVTVSAGVATVAAVPPAPVTAHTATAAVSTVLAVAPSPSDAVTATAGVASVLAVASAPSDAVTVNAGVAIVNAVAPAPAVNTSGSTNATAGVAAVSVVATAPSVAETATAGVAVSQAVAPPPAAAAASTAGVGIVGAAAPPPSTAGTATAAVGIASAAVPTPSVAGTANAGAGIVGAAAPAPSVSTSGGTNAPAAAAAGVATALSPVPAVAAPAGVAAVQASAPATAPRQVAAGVAAVHAVAAAPVLAAAALAAASGVLTQALAAQGHAVEPFTVGALYASVTPTATQAPTDRATNTLTAGTAPSSTIT